MFVTLYFRVMDSPAFQLVCSVVILNEISLAGTKVSFCVASEAVRRKQLRPTVKKHARDSTLELSLSGRLHSCVKGRLYHGFFGDVADLGAEAGDEERWDRSRGRGLSDGLVVRHSFLIVFLYSVVLQEFVPDFGRVVMTLGVLGDAVSPLGSNNGVLFFVRVCGP